MRALVVSNMYPPHHLGGYELSCRDTVARFRQRGHRVTVLTTTLRLPDTAELSSTDDEGVRRELRFYWRDYQVLRPSLRSRLAIERHNQRVLAAAIDELDPEVISFWNMGAMSMGLLTAVLKRGIPSVLVVCDDWLVYGPLVDAWARLFSRRPRLARLVRPLVGVPTGIADLGTVEAVCFVSDYVRRTAATNTPWCFPRSTVTYSGLDRADFPPLATDERPGPSSGRLLYVGRVEARKGVETPVRALALLPPAHVLELVGPGEPRYVEHLRQLAHSLGAGDRITIGAVARHELRSRYLASDVVVFPSEWEEPFGLIPLEAMACGRPVLATGTGGSAEYLVHEGNCLLFRPGDHEALAAGIRRLEHDAALRHRIVEGGLTTAKGFDTDRLAEVLEEWHVAAARRFSHGLPPDRPPPHLGARR